MTILFIAIAVLCRPIAYIMNRIEHGVIYYCQGSEESHPVIEWWRGQWATLFGWKGIHKSGNIMHIANHLGLFFALMAGLHPLGWKAWLACAVWAFFSRWIASPAQYYINIGSNLPPNPGTWRWTKMVLGLITCVAAFWLI